MSKERYTAEAWEREKARARVKSKERYYALKGDVVHAAIQKKRIKVVYSRKRAMLTEIRQQRGCLDCGRKDGLLHFDHRPGTVKLFNPGMGAQRSIPIMLAEVEKCDVRCHACHMRRHRLERQALLTDKPASHFLEPAT